MVKFTYNVGDGSGFAQQETIVVTLDDNYPPGTQIPWCVCNGWRRYLDWKTRQPM